MIHHPLAPIYDQDSKILILGSFPSVKSRQEMFYYAHPQNRFWKILEALYQEQLLTIDDKIAFLKKHHIALWDVIASCDIEGSSDQSIKNVQVNDIVTLINNSQIKTVYTNGKKAALLYQKYIDLDIKMITLPSSSPANAMYSLEKLIDVWKIIKD